MRASPLRCLILLEPAYTIRIAPRGCHAGKKSGREQGTGTGEMRPAGFVPGGYRAIELASAEALSPDRPLLVPRNGGRPLPQSATSGEGWREPARSGAAISVKQASGAQTQPDVRRSADRSFSSPPCSSAGRGQERGAPAGAVRSFRRRSDTRPVKLRLRRNEQRRGLRQFQPGVSTGRAARMGLRLLGSGVIALPPSRKQRCNSGRLP